MYKIYNIVQYFNKKNNKQRTKNKEPRTKNKEQQTKNKKEKITNYFHEEKLDIFGYNQLAKEGKTLYIVQNIIDVLVFDAYQLSAIAFNPSNIKAFSDAIKPLKSRFKEIIIVGVENSTQHSELLSFAKKQSINTMLLPANNMVNRTVYELFANGFAIEKFISILSENSKFDDNETAFLFTAS